MYLFGLKTDCFCPKKLYANVCRVIIDNLRNGLETQAKVYVTSVIRFTLEPCNFTLNTFQDSVQARN